MATITENREKTESEMNTKLEACKKALESGEKRTFDHAFAELEESVKTVNKMIQKEAFESLSKEEKPFEAFAKMFFYTGRAVKTEHPKGNLRAISGVKIENAQRRLDILDFIKECNYSNGIATKAAELLTALGIRLTTTFGTKPEDLLPDTLITRRMLSDIDEGKTPASNTKIVAKLQAILDECGISGRINNHDTLFVQQCAFVHDAKTKCGLKPVSERRLVSIIVDVLNHHAEGTDYVVLKKWDDESEIPVAIPVDPAPANAEPSPASAEVAA